MNKRLKKSLSNLFDKLVEPNENSDDDDIVLLQEDASHGDEKQEVDALNSVLTCLSTYEVIEEKLKLKKKSIKVGIPF